MLRSRVVWFACALVSASFAACGSSAPEKSGASHAADSGSESDTDAGPSESTGSTKAGSNGKSDAGSKTSGSTSSTGSGGKGGSGGTGGSAGTGGSRANAASDKLPDDGNQLSVCSMAQGDCNKGLACSGSASPVAESRNYCTKICESDEDCSGVTPSSAKYTCSTGRGIKLCEIACSGSEDTSCPTNMQCVQTGVSVEAAANGGSGGAGGNGGRGSNALVPVYHCKYPLITSPLWGPCQDGEHQCDKDATCYGSAAGRPGVCTKSCTMDSDCSEKPSSGSITPSCATINAGRGNMMETKLCVLSCLDKKDGCPDGTTCVEGPRATMGRGGMMGRGRGPGMDMADAGSTNEGDPAYARCE